MKQGTAGRAETLIYASPDTLYGMVSDVTRMGEWSPETYRCQWLDGATGPQLGARFKGSNRRGILRWSTTPRVVVAEPGREFAFVHAHGKRDSTRWSYRFEPGPGTTTKVSESFELMNDEQWYYVFSERVLMGVRDRAADLQAAMSQTLSRLKVAAERVTSSQP